MARRGALAGAVLAAFTLSACAPPEPAPPEAPVEARLELRATSFGQLTGWLEDDPREAIAALRRSCEALAAKDPDLPIGTRPTFGAVGDWRPACTAAATADDRSVAGARAYFEAQFQPYHVLDGDDPEGLFTGYYEPLLYGSRRPGGPYRTPIHRPPDDLLRIDLGRFNPDLAGLAVYGRVVDGSFVPYHSRADIDAGALGGRGLELLWVDDPVDKFFLQIQGSGQVRLEDGELVRIGYAGQNGHPYRAIGRDLIEIGALDREGVSMQSIRAWVDANPGAAKGILERNRAYVFFEERPQLAPDEGPLGAQKVPLTASRSLAVDRRHIPLGVPVWLDTTAPWPDGERPLRRLMVTQDTGGAIKGVVRGDVFWGTGAEAEAVAGAMRSKGRYTVLLPKGLTPTS